MHDIVLGAYAFFGCKKWNKAMVCNCQIMAYAFHETGLLETYAGDKKVVIIGETIIDIKEEKEVIVCHGIKKIAAYACYGNKKITRLVLPEGLKEIGAYAFYGCTELCEVSLPDSLEIIEESAFEKCIKIKIISSKVSFLCQSAFAFCKSLCVAKFPNIKEFKKETFFGCEHLEVIKAEAVEQIDEACFKACKTLQDLPSNNIKEIKEEAFANCESLQNLYFFSSVIIAAKAFLDCCELLCLSFLDSFAVFDSTSFSGCTFLEKVQVGKKEYYFSGYNDLFQEQLPEFIKKIYISVFNCFYFQNTNTIATYRNNAKAVKIPEGITVINGEVFRDCVQLEQIELPKSILFIGERAFFGTSWLKKKKEEQSLVIVNHILLDGTGTTLEKVVIPKEVQRISGWAFANCYKLKELVLCNPNIIIELHAFRNCIYLKSVTIEKETYFLDGLWVRKEESLPEDVKQIFEDALNCYKTDSQDVLIECTGNITRFALIDGITAIGKDVFKESNLLTYAMLTKDVKWIGESAFEHCKWLEQVFYAENVKEIKTRAFFGCTRLKSIQCLKSLKKIGTRAFENCVSLQEIRLPEGIKEIPQRAFFRCRSLTHLFLPSSLEKIGKEAFAFCDSLEEIILPESIVMIEDRAFAWCKKLTIEKIPEQTKLGKQVFEFSFVSNRKEFDD